MNRTTPPKPPARTAADSRREREAEALRANLRKRKEQQRARESSVDAAEIKGQPPGPAEDSPGGRS